MLRWLFALLTVLFVFVFEGRALALTCPETISSQVTSPADPKQNGRLNRGTPVTTCAAPTAAPSVVGAGSSFTYEAHTFKNRTTGTCMTVTLQSNDDLSAAAYLGSFVPTNIQQNYIGDSGNRASAGNPKTFSVTVPSLSDFVVVVAEGVDGQGGNYQLNVTGCGEVLVSSITPNFGSTAGGTNVTIKGAGFLALPSLPTVRFGGQGGTQATNVAVTDEFTLTATTPAHAAGAVDVFVRNQNNSNGSLVGGFTYYDPVASTVTLASSKNPSVYGEAVTYSVHVDPNVPKPPTGQIQFLTSNIIFASATLDASGNASFTTGALPPGTHTLTAQYGGDSIHLPATSNTVTQVIGKPDTTVTLISSTNPSLLGQPVTFTATASPVAPGQGIPTGNVIFTEQGVVTPLATIALDANGQAKLTVSNFTTGTHVIRAEYVGDANFLGATSSGLSQVVNLTGTTVALVSSQNPSTLNTNVTFTATVSSNGGTPSVTGTITFSDNGVALGAPITLVQNKATLSISTLTIGTHTISAVYSGDAANAPATGSVSQVVDGAATTTTLTSSANPSIFLTNLTFTATVTSAFAGTITGNVAFKNGSTTLGTGTVTNGTATFSIADIPVGTHPVVAVYEGAASYKTSTSAVLSQVVKDPVTADAGVDSGTPDAAKPDSATPGIDATVPDASIPSVPAIEGGGCDCRSSTLPDAGALGGIATLAAVLLGLIGRRRRRT